MRGGSIAGTTIMSALTTEPLIRVQEAAREAAAARQRLEAAIRAARSAGISLRAIAEASGMNHETVRMIAKNDRPSHHSNTAS